VTVARFVASRNLSERNHAVATSARSGQGVATLRGLLRERTTALVGLSGTGKSSLASAIQPGLRLRTNEVSAFNSQGRHTTTQAVMLRLEMGGGIVDTPGIREFGLGGLGRRELAGHFPEIAALATGCKFADCHHLGEPGCAILQALETGSVAASRYHSYRKIYGPLPS